MHLCLYEGWCNREDVEEAAKRIERIVEEARKRILKVG